MVTYLPVLGKYTNNDISYLTPETESLEAQRPFLDAVSIRYDIAAPVHALHQTVKRESPTGWFRMPRQAMGRPNYRSSTKDRTAIGIYEITSTQETRTHTRTHASTHARGVGKIAKREDPSIKERFYAVLNEWKPAVPRRRIEETGGEGS